jgi:acetyl-CoA synthetase
VAVGGDGPLAHVFTAGTTGPPKAIPVPVRALAAFGVARLTAGGGARDDRPDDVHWDTADPGWATGLYSAILGPLATGRRGLLTRGSLAPAPGWRLLDRYRVTHLHAGPAHFRAMAVAGPPPPGLVLRYVSSTGEPLPPELATWAEDVLGHPLHERYGQAELGTVLVDVPGCGPGTTGRPLPGWTLGVLADERDRPAPSGVVGRLAVDRDASPLMWFTGYAGDPELTAASFTRDGRWYLTGDIAGVDVDGCHRFSARAGDVIVTAGHRIAPFEVETVLMLHDDVAEAVVVGVSTARHGTVPEAFVVLRPGAEPVYGLADELKRLVRTKLAAHAVPIMVHVVDVLPRTPGGSVRRAALRERRVDW